MESPPTQFALSPQRRRVFALVLLAMALAGGEIVARIALGTRHFRDFEVTRLRLSGGAESASQGCVGQAYLLYVPAPFAKDQAARGHNAFGYRGRPVPMTRTPGVLRVLCLGGSTTYGWSVDDPALAYPAKLEQHLRAELGSETVEVINAGVPWATSAEILTHYHFKWHYFRPDLVIVNAGGNDGEAISTPYYQPDYSHWRHQPCVATALPPQTRWLMRSRLAALVYVSAFRWTPGQPWSRFADADGAMPLTPWYPDAGPIDPLQREIPEAEDALRHNLEALLREIRSDGASVLMVPFRERPDNRYSAAVRRGDAHDERVVRAIAAEQSLPLAPFPASVISAGNWSDDYCHLTAAGEAEKAAYLAPFAAQLLRERRGLSPAASP